jgi:hypothetical protein
MAADTIIRTLIRRLLHSLHPVFDLLCGRRLYCFGGDSCDIEASRRAIYVRGRLGGKKWNGNEERGTKNERARVNSRQLATRN